MADDKAEPRDWVVERIKQPRLGLRGLGKVYVGFGLVLTPSLKKALEALENMPAPTKLLDEIDQVLNEQKGKK